MLSWAPLALGVRHLLGDLRYLADHARKSARSQTREHSCTRYCAATLCWKDPTHFVSFKLCNTFAVSVASSLVDQELGLGILSAGIACIAPGEVRRGSRGLYVRVDEAARLRLPESVLPSPGRAVRLLERVQPTLPALTSAAEGTSAPLPQNQASPTTLEVSERLTLIPSRRPWRWLVRAWTYLRAFWRRSPREDQVHFIIYATERADAIKLH